MLLYRYFLIGIAVVFFISLLIWLFYLRAPRLRHLQSPFNNLGIMFNRHGAVCPALQVAEDDAQDFSALTQALLESLPRTLNTTLANVDLHQEAMCIRHRVIWGGKRYPVNLQLLPFPGHKVFLICSAPEPGIKESAPAAERPAATMSEQKALWYWDCQQNQVQWSAGCFRMLGYEPQVLSEDFLQQISHRDDSRSLLQAVHQTLVTGQPFVMEHRYLSVQNEWLWVESRGRVYSRDADGFPRVLTGSMLNIQQRRQQDDLSRSARRYQQQQLENISHFDSLTGALTPRLFEYRIRSNWQQERQRNALVLFQVTNLKAVNAGLGLDAGDYLLRHLAYRLHQPLSPEDSLARLRGVVFAYHLHEVACQDKTEHFIRQLLAQLQDTLIWQGEPLPVQLKAGVAFLHHQGHLPSVSYCLAQAQQALETAKSCHRTLLHCIELN